MRTLDEIGRDRNVLTRTREESQREARFYVRVGRVVELMERLEPEARTSRAIQVAKTWRSHGAWHLANSLGWRRRR